MQKVLVAGATGYLGRHVVREFKEKGYWVRVLARNPVKLESVGPFLEPAVSDMADEVFIGEVTSPETLVRLCQDIDIVFSSVGITRQKDKLSYRNVDYQGNLNILNVALQQNVRKFIYVSVFGARFFEHLAIIRAHEDFVRALHGSGLDYTIIRPTGYFSDMTEYLKMAKSGRVYLIGNGNNRINPIHGADLAEVCVGAVNSKEREIPVGGPAVYTGNQIAGLAFRALGKRPKVIRIPILLGKAAVKVSRLFSGQMADLIEFVIAAGTSDGVAPAHGKHTLPEYYEEYVSLRFRNG